MSNEAAAAAGLSDVIDVDSEEVDDPTVVDVDTSGDRDDEGIATDATVTQLPVRLEPSDATTAAGMSLVPVRDELKGLTELAVTLAIAENTPKDLKGRPASVLAVFLTGRELGIPPMTALRNLHVIDGKVTVNPKVRAAMVRREGLGKLWPHQGPREVACPGLERAEHDEDCTLCGGSDRVFRLCECGSDNGDNSADVCTWHAKRADDPNVIYSATYTLAMATNAKLTNKDNWKNYPDRMLSWRALGYLLDDAFPEIGTGLYSPDELGAITDEEGEPIIDVNSTEVLTEKASRERKERGAAGKPDPNPAASPDTIATFKARIEKIKGYKGAADALKGLWQADDGTGQPKLPPVDQLLYKDCKLAAAMLDSIEKRIDKGEFVQVESDAVVVGEDAAGGDEADGEDPAGDDGQGGGDPAPDDEPESGGDAVAAEPTDSQETPSDEPGEPQLALDVESLPEGLSPADDLAWTEAAVNADPLLARAVIDEVATEVQAIDKDELIGIMKLLDLSPNSLNEATKRARIAARRARLRFARLAGLR